MGRKFITPLQDTSIYEQFQSRNTGFDEIIEVGKSTAINGAIRGLIEFDIEGKLSGIVPLDSTFWLNLRIAHADNFKRNQTVEFYHVSESWDEGTGFFEQDLENSRDGAVWTVKDSSDVTWSLAGGTTGSLRASQSFDFEPDDIRLDISDVVRAWITGSDNNGLLIKIPTVDEENDRVLSNIRFFSRNTHTIYPPTIEAVFNTQTINVLPNCGLVVAPDEIELFVVNPRPEFVTGSTQRIRFGARTVQPIKSFSDVFRFGNKFFFPSASQIGVVDTATEAFIVPFDSGSLISADSTGSFFDLKIENMYIGRSYTILVRIQKSWGSEVVNTGHTFRVVNT